jgi:hypothetical protein
MFGDGSLSFQEFAMREPLLLAFMHDAPLHLPRGFVIILSMTIQQIQRLRERQPFEPFRIVTADGSRYDVRHPENLATTGNGRIIVVAMHDYAATLDLLLVTGIEQPIPLKKNGSGRKAS